MEGPGKLARPSTHACGEGCGRAAQLESALARHAPFGWNAPAVSARSRRLLVALAALAVVTVPISHWRYTSIGFDLRSHVGPDRVNREYRLRWPGDGTVGVLYQRVREPIFEPLDAFDVALRVLQPPERRAPRSAWNRAGFWRVRTDRLRGAASVSTRWIGVPSWVPAALLVLVLLGSRRRPRAGAAGERPLLSGARASAPREERT
jgi:hypothetical protein